MRNSFKGLFLVCLSVIMLAAGVAAQEDGSGGFRIEKVPVAGGAEIITIFAKSGLLTGEDGSGKEVPMVSVLRDTLGDDVMENDQLRYVWMHTYAKPTFWQSAASMVPFNYNRVGGRSKVSGLPPSIADMKTSSRTMWNQVIWTVLKRVVRSEAGLGGKATLAQFRRNSKDHRRTAVASALTVLALYEAVEGESLLSRSELKDIQARLWLIDRPLGWHMKDENLHRVYEREITGIKFKRGINWELLRQYSEAQGLYFDPLEMPDGEARHAMLWVAADDLAERSGRKFNSRFLNIKNPWNDSRLRRWDGYTQTRWFDADNRVVAEGTPGARLRRMIPLALYGLDYPKIPVILVDFRDSYNPKRREMSRRILNDVTSNMLGISKFSSLAYFAGRYVYDHVTKKSGADINQLSRQNAYAQAKVLLSLENDLDDGLEHELVKRIDSVSLNPLEIDALSQVRIASQQYANLLAYARRPDGLPSKLDRERRKEMEKLAHGGRERFMFGLANVLTLGIYKHREKATPEMLAKMDKRRQLDHHERTLRETAFNSSGPEIDSDMGAVRRALQFVAANGSAAGSKTSRALARIFRIAPDDELRSMCLAGLFRIDNSSAKKELLAIYKDPKLDGSWRESSARYLRRALDERQRISKRDAASIATIEAN